MVIVALLLVLLHCKLLHCCGYCYSIFCIVINIVALLLFIVSMLLYLLFIDIVYGFIVNLQYRSLLLQYCESGSSPMNVEQR